MSSNEVPQTPSTFGDPAGARPDPEPHRSPGHDLGLSEKKD